MASAGRHAAWVRSTHVVVVHEDAGRRIPSAKPLGLIYDTPRSLHVVSIRKLEEAIGR
jgi:hypothetical protein